VKQRPPAMNVFADIAARIRTLAKFYTEHKPGVSQIYLYPEDFKIVKSFPKLSIHYGFVFAGDEISFDGFKLLPMVTPHAR
jgi:hypothetical protein